MSGILIFQLFVPLGVAKSVLTQNLHFTPSRQQAEQAGFTRAKIPRRASQFFLKINKRQPRVGGRGLSAQVALRLCNRPTQQHHVKQ
jgi:hypothetical protein